MALEIERRFLVDPQELPRPLPAGQPILQGFLSLEPVVRVRLLRGKRGRNPRALLTVKGRGLRVRAEYEYAIPVPDARRLLRLCGTRLVQKIRYRLGPWELDRYLGRHKGLWTAEIELRREHASLPDPLPRWLKREVTNDPRFTNVRLASAKPFLIEKMQP